MSGLPDEGESITNWAKSEAKYRRQKTAPDGSSKVPEAKRVMTTECSEWEFQWDVRLNGVTGPYKNGPRKACFWSNPKMRDGGNRHRACASRPR